MTTTTTTKTTARFAIEKEWDGNECVTERGNRVYVSRGRWQWIVLVDGEPHSTHDLKRDAVRCIGQLEADAAQDLAESLRACTGAVSVTVRDGATTATATTGLRLRPGRELTQRGGYGVQRELRTMRSDAAVYWSTPLANSYVAVQDADGFRVLSINGIGEVRWSIDPLNCGWTGDDSAQDAVAYFFEDGGVR